MLEQESGNIIEGDDALLVVEIRVAGTGNDAQLFVLALQGFEGILTKVAAVSFLPMEEQHRAAYLTAACKKRRVQKGEGGGDSPAAVGVQ